MSGIHQHSRFLSLRNYKNTCADTPESSMEMRSSLRLYLSSVLVFRYDWSIVSKVAEHHLLDRVIGGKMGREHVDVFSCLLSRSMRNILVHILSLLGDHDLIR